MPTSSEQQLQRDFAAGRSEAVERVVELYQEAVTRLVRRMIGWSAESDVADLVQEVFVKAIVARRTFRQQASLKTWLLRIAINQCRSHLRNSDRRQALLRWWHAGLGSRHHPPADRRAGEKEQSEQVRQAVAELPLADREIVVLHYFEEMSQTEIAELLSIKPGTVATRLSRARSKLAKLLPSELQPQG